MSDIMAQKKDMVRAVHWPPGTAGPAWNAKGV